jgi:hypothetical protein
MPFGRSSSGSGSGTTGSVPKLSACPPSTFGSSSQSKAVKPLSGGRCGRSNRPVSAQTMAFITDVLPAPFAPSSNVMSEWISSEKTSGGSAAVQ